MTCKKCGGEMKLGKAIKERLRPECGLPDFPGDTADSIGQTFSFVHDGADMIDCLKCTSCGHSVQGAHQTRQEVDGDE